LKEAGDITGIDKVFFPSIEKEYGHICVVSIQLVKMRF
jgi:hypothetical protein